MTKADPENRRLFTEADYRFAGNAGLFGSAGTRRYDDFFRLHGRNFFECDLVIAKYLHIRAKLAQIVVKVVGEGIVVIDQEDHRFLHCSASSMALSMPRALFSVS